MASVVGEASSSSSPSTSIPPQRLCTYHVFLSFSGQDTRKGFTDHLYAALERKGITTFGDDKDLEKGEVISVELLKAIEESMFAITVLSPNYASSTWCLDELQKIVECRNNLGLEIVPIFYDVEPSDVRHQRGSYEVAFRKHEERFGQDSEKIKRWRDALTQIANYSSWNSKNQHEARLVESIAQGIHKKLIPKLPSSTDKLVGIASRVEDVSRHIGYGLNDIRFIGIWGMGGIGKTTIARVVYEAIQGEFKFSSFLPNLKETCGREGIVQIQKKLAADMNISPSTFNNEYDGRRIIQKSLCHKKVLLVLDDVSKEYQLENLAGEQNWFGPGSRIIITTRDLQLLKRPKVHGIYKVEELVQIEAFDLFCLKAFKGRNPVEGYLHLSKEVVNLCGGLPLALEVLGSHLSDRSVDMWKSSIAKLKRFVPHDILDKLKISFDTLDFMEQDIFLDIACFFDGMDKDEVTDILNKCGYCAEIGIAILINRYLVTINQKSNMLEMHDLLRDMGRNIVIQESPKDPSKRSRLWSKEDIDFVLTRDKGTEAIQSIGLRPGHACYEARWSTKAFSKTIQLKFLRIYGMELPLGLDFLPSSLKVLHWRRCPLKTLPFADQQYEVVEIKLRYSKIEQLWHGKKFLEKLKHLDLSHSWYLKKTPDLSAVPILETLVLEECSDLTEVHLSLIQHKGLVLLNLSKCISLKSLPGKLEMSSLKELILKDCWSFENLSEFEECMKYLSRLSLEGTAIRKLPTSLGCLVGLEDLSLDRCKLLVCLPDTIHGLKSLKMLNASECPNLCRLICKEELYAIEFKLPHFVSRLHFLGNLDLSYCGLTEESFPHDFFHLPLLIDLNLGGNYFVSIPISIHELPKLRCLRLNSCRKLQSLPRLPSSIRELEAYNCDSLNKSKFNPLSKACDVLASSSQKYGQVLQMLISGSEIPSWFVHQEDSNCASVSILHNCPPNESLGIAFCFQLQTSGGCPDHCYRPRWSLIFRNGKRFITRTIFPKEKPSSHLYILYLTSEYLGDEFHQDNLFELLVEDCCFIKVQILRSATRWVVKQDTEDLIKSETEGAKSK